MVCAKCQKKLKQTELATPGVKRKSEMYYGSPATSGSGSASSSHTDKSKPTLGNTGIGKVSRCSPILLVPVTNPKTPE